VLAGSNSPRDNAGDGSASQSKTTMRWIAAAAISVFAHLVLLFSRLPVGEVEVAPQSAPQALQARVVFDPLANPLPGMLEVSGAVASSQIEKTGMSETPPKADSPPPSAADTRKTGLTNRRFFTIEEVDQAALPTLDWELSQQLAAKLKLRRLVVELWISNTGQLLDIEIVSSAPETTSGQREEIVKSLLQTTMTPAVKNGLMVPSHRTLEMGFDSDPDR
jgi:hypothetical protein